MLDEILANTRREVDERARLVPADMLRSQIAVRSGTRSLERALCRPGMQVIAEVKRRSPSKGDIAANADAAAVARTYASSGAAAISVLTDDRFFGGSLDDLRAVCDAVSVPVLRKDFVIDEYQLLEARACGADAVLLIAAALGQRRLGELIAAAADLRLEALVEVHTAAEAVQAIAAGARVVGVNNRDLRSFTTDLAVTEQVAPHLHGAVVIVSESGIRDAGDVARVAAAGAGAVLVGETLMTAPDTAVALRRLVRA